MSLKRLLLLPACLAVSLCIAAEDAEKTPSKKAQEFLGDKTIAILQGATRVETFRVDADSSKPGANRVGGYAITATGKEQDKEFTAKLAGVLLDDGAYFGVQAQCFDPGVAFRLWKNKESVEVVICFHCSNLKLGARDAKGKVFDETENLKVGGFGGADGSYGRLVKLAKEAFPDDKDIQALKEKGK
jgi:hypothetical protein